MNAEQEKEFLMILASAGLFAPLFYGISGFVALIDAFIKERKNNGKININLLIRIILIFIFTIIILGIFILFILC